MKPLDYETRARVVKALKDAQLTGADPVDYLHRHGLIASATLRDHYRGEAIRDVYDRLRMTQAPFPVSFWEMLQGWIRDAKTGKWR